MRTVLEYLKGCTFKDLMTAVAVLYAEIKQPLAPHTRRAWFKMWTYLMQLTPVDTDMVVVFNWHMATEEDPNNYWHVSGYSTDPDEEYDGLWAMEFVPWAEWLSMPIDAQNLNLQEPYMLAHILYEMTFYGFDEPDVKAKLAHVNKEVVTIVI